MDRRAKSVFRFRQNKSLTKVHIAAIFDKNIKIIVLINIEILWGAYVTFRPVSGRYVVQFTPGPVCAHPIVFER
jgi:hypothetical protein